MEPQEFIEEKLRDLKTKNYNTLESLPEYSQESLIGFGSRAKLAIWRDSDGQKGIRVVVQFIQYTLLPGVSLVKSEGFWMEKSGNIIPLTDEDYNLF